MSKEVLQGTLDLMVLRTLAAMGPQHGLGLAKRILQVSEGLLDLNQGTLYPALLRLEQRRWIKSRWGVSDNNRKAKFYELTARGRRQIREETEKLGTDGGPDGEVSRQAGRRAVTWGRVLDVFRRRRLDADLDSQLAYHLDGLEAEARAQGLSPDEARAAARRAMGGLTQVQDAYRDQLTIPVIDTLWQDVRYALRAMRHNLTFTVVVVLTLALGIGANTAVFSVLNSVLLKPLSYPRAEELVALRQIAPGAGGSSASDGLNLSPSMYLTYAEQNRVFQSLGVWVTTISTVTGLAEPEQVRVDRHQRWRPPGAQRSARGRPLAARPRTRLGATRPPPSVFRAYDHRDAQLRVLAAAFRRRPIRDRAHHHRGFAPEGNRRRDARRDSGSAMPKRI